MKEIRNPRQRAKSPANRKKEEERLPVTLKIKLSFNTRYIFKQNDQITYFYLLVVTINCKNNKKFIFPKLYFNII